MTMLLTASQREKRKRVMTRAIKLGHCVCDPRKPCPCPLFREKNVCTCAGERMPPEGAGAPVRLTRHVRHAGCASKIAQKDLHEVLGRLPAVEDPRLLVGMATADDAGVFRLAPGVTLVQTVDVFTPSVDDPYTFGRIAACNSLSDVYAMGGSPVTALSIIGFPIEDLPPEAMADIIRGGMDVLKQAGVVLLGGHSINDEEVKFGFAVTGVVKEAELVTNAGARPGDVLILTKPLGTGIVSLANQIGRATPESVAALMASMVTLNNTAAEIMVRHRARAGTDVTGFGFIGHLRQIVVESRVAAEIWADRLPLLPGALDYAAQGMFSGANERNAEYTQAIATFDADVPDAVKAVCFDAQTSGGLLMALPRAAAEDALRDLHEAGIHAAALVGRITGPSEGRIHVRRTSDSEPEPSGTTRGTPPRKEAMKKTTESGREACCSQSSGEARDAVEGFSDFLGAALTPGALDIATKEYIAIALALAVNCVPCARIHLKKAKIMGMTLKEIEEVAALAIAFGGCRAMMLWNELKKELA